MPYTQQTWLIHHSTDDEPSLHSGARALLMPESQPGKETP